jgi:transglutaminase-like putative cysteine protease
MLTLQGYYEQIGGETRTLLFAAGWCMMTSVVHALLVQRQQAVWLGGVTMLYLLLMQLIFGIDTTVGVLRSFLWTGLLLALLLPDRLARTRGVKLTPAMAMRWSAAALLPLALCAALGWYGWKPAGAGDLQQMMKPLDYSMFSSWPFQGRWPFSGGGAQAAASPAGNVVARTGYSSDDSFLGGPIQPDDSVAFEARTSELTYWRGESRSVYTGKGWQQSAAKPVPFRQPDAYEAVGSQASDTAIIQQVTLPAPFATKLLFAGGSLLHADALTSAQGTIIPSESLLYDAASGAYSLPELADPAVSYRVEVRKPHTDPDVLRQDSAPYPQDIADENVQLPAELPERVRELARSITAEAGGPYDKAEAIAAYLRTQYRYSMSEPTKPAANEDFVDHFLFVDKTGYCDQFSTAMAVLLRAVGVPARWVKGYAPGTEISGAADTASPLTAELPLSPSPNQSPAAPTSESTASALDQSSVPSPESTAAAPDQSSAPSPESTASASDRSSASSPISSSAPRAAGLSPPQPALHTVVVRNRDAHSWVEVYFPSAGWVAFDPTPGFAGAGTGTAGSAAAYGSPAVVSSPQASTVIGATLGTDPVQAADVQFRLSGGGTPPASGGSPSSTMLHNFGRNLQAWWSQVAALPQSGYLVPALAALAAAVVAAVALFCFARSKRLLLLLPLRAYAASANKPHQRELLLMNSLWRRLYRIYGGKAPHETMREYVARIREADEGRRAALTEFAGLYEQTSYNPLRRRPVTRRALRDLWRRMSSGPRRR